MPLEQLALSPQCGFASTEEGNILTEDAQWAKLREIVEIATMSGTDPAAEGLSRLEEHRLVLALEADVEDVAADARRRAVARATSVVAAIGRHQRQDRVAGVGRLVGEIDAREQPLEQAAREDADVDVRRLQRRRRVRAPGRASPS